MQNIQSEKCIHCDPIKQHPYHLNEQIEKYFSILFYPIYLIDNLFKKKSYRQFLKFNIFAINTLFRSLLRLGFLQENSIVPNDNSLNGRSLILLHEAQKRNLAVQSLKLFGKQHTNHFSIVFDNKKIFFEGLPTIELGHVFKLNFDDKSEFKKLLEAHRLPHAQGESFSSINAAVFFGKKIGFPLVVKPRAGSLSKHTTYNILNEAKLTEAVRIVKIISREFILEEFIEGNVYRITIVDGEVIASCLREAPNVVGDGIHTISELVRIKNDHPWRGERNQKNFTLHKISLNSKANSLLAQQNMTIQSVPKNGKKVYLHDKIVLSAGADIHDVTDIVHLDNILLFKKVYSICEASVIGIDFIIPDITKSYRFQKSGIIEVNSLPYINMHHYPVTGQPRNVAGALLDYFIKIHRVK